MVIWSIPYCRYFFVSFVSVKALKYDYVDKVILCLGSNTDCEANLKSAASLLRAYFGSIRFSEAIYTEPIGLPDSGLFLNQVAVVGTNASLEEVRRAVKAMEKPDWDACRTVSRKGRFRSI